MGERTVNSLVPTAAPDRAGAATTMTLRDSQLPKKRRGAYASLRSPNTMTILQEFKTFIARGNVVDLAVGVIIGAAFGRIVTSMVEDLLMPPIGFIAGNLDFTNMYLPLSSKVAEAVAKAGHAIPLTDAKKIGPVLAWGNFLTVLINFAIVAVCVFVLVKAINRLRRKEAVAPSTPPAPSREEILLTEIRDELRGRSGSPC